MNFLTVCDQIPNKPKRTQTILEFIQEPKNMKQVTAHEFLEELNPRDLLNQMDEKTVRIHSQPERKIIDEMPIRSSLFNTLFLVPYIFIVIVLAKIGGDFLNQDKRDLMGIPFFIMTIGRTWLVATLTFQKNDSNRQRNAKVERERRRKLEIQDALKNRQQRRNGKNCVLVGISDLLA